MKAHRIFDKGQIVYCLLASHTNPNILLPIKGIIMDSKWDPVNPLYQIRIIKFYDNMKFLKKYFIDMNFRHVFENRDKMQYNEVFLKLKGFTAVGDNKTKDIFKLLKGEKNFITYHETHKNYSANIDKLPFE